MRKNNPTQPEVIKTLIKINEGFEIPQYYLNIMGRSNGLSGIFKNNKSYIMLWTVEEVIKLNPYYKDSILCQYILFFGSNGSNKGYGFSKKDNSIFAIDFLDIDIEQPIKVADSFDDFFSHIE